jgi:hypothetical protein
LKPLYVPFKQEVKFGEQGVRVSNIQWKESIWMKYVGNNKFVSATEGDLMNPSIIPAIVCPVLVTYSPEISKEKIDLYNMIKQAGIQAATAALMQSPTYVEEAASGNYYVIYYRGHLFIYDPVMQSFAIMEDSKTMKKILAAAEQGRIHHKDDVEFSIKAVLIPAPNYFDAV